MLKNIILYYIKISMIKVASDGICTHDSKITSLWLYRLSYKYLQFVLRQRYVNG